MKDYSVKAPSIKDVYQNFWHIVTTFFGVGCITPAPGTWGSFVAWPVFVLLIGPLPPVVSWSIIFATFVVGSVAISKSGPKLGKIDHGSIVIDEVVAVWIVLMIVPSSLLWQFIAVCLFRFFDIVKLPPASTVDSWVQNGWTVMLDDIIASIYVLLVMGGIIGVMQWIA